MVKEDIIRMAREAGMFRLFGDPNAPEALTGESIERFFALAYAAGQRDMREAAARVCENEWGTREEKVAGFWFADAIRALPLEGEKE
jgi:hypothetical protein